MSEPSDLGYEVFNADLDRLTEGVSSETFLDDREFNWLVDEMERHGHPRERTATALRYWIDLESEDVT